ncbi:MAG: thermonuclease family protein [Bacilli bacterium]|nr:thermonuclease family protein [Bacilli bacterium]
MKKTVFIILLTLIIPMNVSAKKVKVKLDKCIDGDTVSIIDKNKKEIKIRFLAVDSPEIDKEEPYSNEAKEFTCNLLKNAKNIYLEDDKKADKYDKYERKLSWVWADDTLVQIELIKNGYAKVAYLYDDYKYASELKKYEKMAIDEEINIWSNKDSQEPKIVKKKTKKKETILDKLNKYYHLFAVLLGMILAMITHKIKKKK